LHVTYRSSRRSGTNRLGHGLSLTGSYIAKSRARRYAKHNSSTQATVG
jgi:hypothetical protein